MYTKDLGNGKYQLTLSVGTKGERKRYYKTVKARNKTELNREMKLFEQSYLKGEFEKPRRCDLTVAEVCQLMLDEHISVGLKPLSVVSYECSLKRIKKYSIANMTYSDVTNGDIQRFIDAMQKKYAPATVQLAYVFLKLVLDSFESIEGFPSPMKKIKLPKLKSVSKTPKSLTKDEFMIFYQNLNLLPLLDKVCIELALFVGGMRISEVTALRWDKIKDCTVSIEQNAVRVDKEWIIQDPKTESSVRTAVMPQFVFDDLNQLHEEQIARGVISPYVAIKENGTRVSSQYVNSVLKDFFEQIGLEYRSFHKLRHTYTSLLVWLHTDVNITRQQVGHSNVSTTLKVYTHDFETAEASSKQVADKVEDYINHKMTV